MAGVPEKARFYLERAVPQLREFEAKSIFTSDEIRSLVRKRTDFEHLVLSPGNKPSDWLNYAAWEKSLEALRAKRCRRLQIRTSSRHTGEGRIFAILDRAVGRHPGSVELWKEYLAYAQGLNATKRYRKTMSRALRMHPTKPELWVLAGRRAAQHGDMQAARNFFMRGARFCTRDATIMLEYARCEMEWLERMDARREKKGGAEKALEEQAEKSDDEIQFPGEESDDDVDENGRLVAPDPREPAEKKVFDEDMAKKLRGNPALDGAIPVAIFDICKKQPFFKAATGEQFFDLFATFHTVSAQARLIQHVLDGMTEIDPHNPSTSFCQFRQPFINIGISTPSYPEALREALSRLKSSLPTSTSQPLLAEKVRSWIGPILASQDFDPGIRTVLEHTLRTLPKPQGSLLFTMGAGIAGGAGG
ncbi:U3 small nucleolar RNA-associated protein 6-domain-containing protein [Durotheca rogersii]|uniref:U3 small nucleolar RNA-associated protein 6-domain-containing protein n=1 Tax=Durotheca rogersii TaxID=419775 RepID=UPI0022210326|nr:U3 small nucleolar RNA-associated protein 6-domain-containing protein [Durotheca rogersii]KAI5859842.1 U3 small nucleolar RNA-associated protein 6-domain-containing protein [Durotheca rogersii]